MDLTTRRSLIKRHSKLTIERQCELLGVNRSTLYYKSTKLTSEEIKREEYIRGRIDFWHTKKPCYGVRKLRILLNEQDEIEIGRKLIKRYMAEMGIYAIYPKPNLSKRNQAHKIFPYLLRNMPIYMPNQVWAIDITYIKMSHGHMYLTAIIDWYSRFIVAWELSDTLDTAPVLVAVKGAVKTYGTPAIINSDQGSQFTSDEYVSYLKEQKIRQSMDGKARWVDNVIIERWFRSLKTENIYINEYATPRMLRQGISNYVREYNTERPHQTLCYKTPYAIFNTKFMVKNVIDSKPA